MPPPMNIIVAVDEEDGIGKGNALPWRLPREYAHFVKQTIQTSGEGKVNAVVMGRRCWESIPAKYRPLKGRVNVVLSRTMQEVVEGDLIVSGEMDKALKILTESPEFANRVETIWNVGGSDIYSIGLTHPWLHKIVLTRIHHTYDCDVKFPAVDWRQFERNYDFPEGNSTEENGIKWEVISYTRKAEAKENGENH